MKALFAALVFLGITSQAASEEIVLPASEGVITSTLDTANLTWFKDNSGNIHVMLPRIDIDSLLLGADEDPLIYELRKKAIPTTKSDGKLMYLLTEEQYGQYQDLTSNEVKDTAIRYESLQGKSIVVLTVPTPDTKVLFGDYRTTQTGRVREYVTPVLSAGKHHYIVTVTWTDANGKEQSRHKRVRVRPDQRVTITIK